MAMNKKAISPVVATALLLVVAVVAVVGFQTWFNNYQSGINAKVEQQSSTGVPITVERVETDAVFVKNSKTGQANITSISVDGTSCASSVTVQPEDTKRVPCSSTIGSAGNIASVAITTNDGVYSAEKVIK